MIYRTEIGEAMIDMLPIIIANIDTGVITDATPAAEELFEYNISGSLVGVCVDELVPPENREIHKQFRTDYAARPRKIIMGQARTISGLKKHGEVFPIKAMLKPKLMGGRPSVVVVILDLTETLKTDSQLATST